MAKIDFSTAGTAQLLQVCLHHAHEAEKRRTFYQTKSTAAYKEEAAGYAQDWLELYGALAMKLEILLEAERAGLIETL